VDSSSLESQPQEKATPVPTKKEMPPGLQNLRRKEKQGLEEITSFSPLSGGRQMCVMFRPACKGTQGSLSQQENTVERIIMNF
jgi:hypothetical protein